MDQRVWLVARGGVISMSCRERGFSRREGRREGRRVGRRVGRSVGRRVGRGVGREL